MSTLKRWLLFRAADFLSALCFTIFACIVTSSWELEGFFASLFGGLFVWYFALLYLPVTIFVSAYFIRRAEFKTNIKYELRFFGIHFLITSFIILLGNGAKAIPLYAALVPFVIIFYSALYIYVKRENNIAILKSKNLL